MYNRLLNIPHTISPHNFCLGASDRASGKWSLSRKSRKLRRGRVRCGQGLLPGLYTADSVQCHRRVRFWSFWPFSIPCPAKTPGSSIGCFILIFSSFVWIISRIPSSQRGGRSSIEKANSGAVAGLTHAPTAEDIISPDRGSGGLGSARGEVIIRCGASEQHAQSMA
ncbi:hypothetical protein BOTBODRAFT_394405 [Botryobasidium botryosum FD-172 SS1]|uniref:Uncharacterized protein n=1 Tax=Botryobasidium botryosum (strain FD-172 SS1) TaxID=930990 RepID=A0A067N8D5_BOTB1|nr:hypothetical protein BOTBODRAFT_394405 [Botryobasidium botryosum FD-172 SS1]